LISRTLRRSLAVFALILALGVGYLLAALILGYIPLNRDFQPASAGTDIFVCSNGVHTDFVLPVKAAAVDWSVRFPATDFAVPIAAFDHVGIGWGDLDFYRTTPHWRDLRLGTAMRALVGLGRAAVHVQYRFGPGSAERCAGLRVDAAHYRALVAYIDAALSPALSPQGSPATPVPGGGYGPTDDFYFARGHFSLLKSCNVWVGEGLKAAGLPTGIWTPFDFLVLAHLK
jgi:uncharacterized protein (TIGR02117 family)